LTAAFEHVLGTVHHHVNRAERLLGGLGDPEGSLMKRQIGTLSVSD